jgi:hypothetical protein
MRVAGTPRELSLVDRLKRLGFARGNQVRLYGAEFELLSDPMVIGETLVFVDALDKKSGLLRRVRIPLTVLHSANGNQNGT